VSDTKTAALYIGAAMIGLLGGMFDPPHRGHVALARAAMEQLGLAELRVLVVADPGHRDVACPVETRMELARAAFPDALIEREDHRYTIDSVRDGRFGDAAFIVGADEFAGFLSWKEPNAVLEHVRLAVGTRPGFPRERLEAVLAHLERPDRVLFFDLEPQDVSSSAIRARAGAGEPVDGLVPEAVARVIDERGLYRRETGVH
jgi:nicotinate-nucleotide adenylyltransferase